MSEDVTAWWRTAITDMEPGRIALRGRPIETLIGNAGFAETVWLLLRGEMPDPARARLLEAALVAAVDHGPQAPSIAAARMAATCGVGLQSAVATGVNMLGDVHGGAGEQCAELLGRVFAAMEDGTPAEEAVPPCLEAWIAERGPFVPGYGHRFHKPVDPRAPRLMELVREAAGAGAVSGRFAVIGEGIADALSAGRPVPMNIDGATAVIFCELGFPPPLARGLFVLSRSVGILAHAWEQTCQGGRNKGPLPPSYLPLYEG